MPININKLKKQELINHLILIGFSPILVSKCTVPQLKDLIHEYNEQKQEEESAKVYQNNIIKMTKVEDNSDDESSSSDDDSTDDSWASI